MVRQRFNGVIKCDAVENFKTIITHIELTKISVFQL